MIIPKVNVLKKIEADIIKSASREPVPRDAEGWNQADVLFELEPLQTLRTTMGNSKVCRSSPLPRHSRSLRARSLDDSGADPPIILFGTADTLIQEWGTVHLPRIAFAGTAFVLAVTELVLG